MKLIERLVNKFEKIDSDAKESNINEARYLLSIMYHGIEKAYFDGNGIMIASHDTEGKTRYFLINAYSLIDDTDDTNSLESSLKSDEMKEIKEKEGKINERN